LFTDVMGFAKSLEALTAREHVFLENGLTLGHPGPDFRPRVSRLLVWYRHFHEHPSWISDRLDIAIPRRHLHDLRYGYMRP
jgi:hypothetical protein